MIRLAQYVQAPWAILNGKERRFLTPFFLNPASTGLPICKACRRQPGVQMETEMVRIADQFVGASKNISLTESELYPLRFTPIYQYRPWGGRRLADLLTEPMPSGPVGAMCLPRVLVCIESGGEI